MLTFLGPFQGIPDSDDTAKSLNDPCSEIRRAVSVENGSRSGAMETSSTSSAHLKAEQSDSHSYYIVNVKTGNWAQQSPDVDISEIVSTNKGDGQGTRVSDIPQV